ncbi:hypothetical protein Pcinc_035913 [Petrolisthes cinctipes]|uniref:Ig-like domain-containing protein n=1 Tax=Petrolisthes cinctipes TaxID=88211 RepID=A0AAE1BVS9_PETCI|nr:hypothetical protein Pcinc_035913 [Petrolisthes cinctipes]
MSRCNQGSNSQRGVGWCVSCPYFLNTPASVTTLAGRPVNLTCGVRNIGQGQQVSWIRWRDLHVLTTGNFTYTSDTRFKALHLLGSPFWTLQVETPRVEDSGDYKCQVSTQPMISRLFTLNVVVARAVIEGDGQVYMKAGSDIKVRCVVRGMMRPHTPVIWYHTLPAPSTSHDIEHKSRTECINKGGRGGVQVITDKRAGTSWLLVTHVTWKDAGNYTCAPALVTPASVTIHVLDEEAPAAMQHDVQPSVGNCPGCHVQVPSLGMLAVLLMPCLTLGQEYIGDTERVMKNKESVGTCLAVCSVFIVTVHWNTRQVLIYFPQL